MQIYYQEVVIMANHKEILRLKILGLIHVQIAQSCECGLETRSPGRYIRLRAPGSAGHRPAT